MALIDRIKYDGPSQALPGEEKKNSREFHKTIKITELKSEVNL